MNRIKQYDHGYDCECDACVNREPPKIERLVYLPEDAYELRLEAAYQEGKNAAHALWLVAAVCVVVAKLVIEAWKG